jgi:hypothetical protein
MFGTSWKKPMAEQLDVSVTRVYQLAQMDNLPVKPAKRLTEIYETWKQTNGVKSTIGVEPIATTLIIKKDAEADLTDEQILERVNKRFAVLNRMANGMIDGKIRSVVVFGAPGVGKTFTIEQALEAAVEDGRIDDYTIIRGTCSAVGLYQALYRARQGGVVVLDDCDSIFNDEEAFNILKTALDSTAKRTIAWRKNASWVYNVDTTDMDGRVVNEDEKLPNRFDFGGGVIFITNVDFREKITQQVRLSPHFEALFSRSMYLDLTLKSMRARMLRIKDVFFNSMKQIEKLTDEQADEIFKYVEQNADRLNELSLRTVKHLCQMYHLGSDWKEIVEYTKMKYPILPETVEPVVAESLYG